MTDAVIIRPNRAVDTVVGDMAEDYLNWLYDQALAQKADTRPMTDAEALDDIQRSILAWMQQLPTAGDVETIARVAEALEASGRPLIKGVDMAANDEG